MWYVFVCGGMVLVNVRCLMLMVVILIGISLM